MGKSVGKWVISQLSIDTSARQTMVRVQGRENVAGVTGSDAAALASQSEGNEGAAVSGTTSSLLNVGCFPSFWSGNDFRAWLDGNYVGELF